MPAGARDRYEEAFEAAPDGLVVLDRAGLVVLLNAHAEHLLGRGQTALIRRPFADALSGDASGSCVARLTAEAGLPVELQVRRADGKEITVEATAGQAETDGGRVVVALRDASGQKREEAALRTQVRRQARVAELGRRALTGIDLGQLMEEAVELLAADLGVEYVNLLELLPDGSAAFRAGVGWRAGLVGEPTVELAAEHARGAGRRATRRRS